ncbi:MAG TPA: ABC-F family ATP-binding cassette domain-containing protein [Candidatus Saccharimonadales bacterium]|nr:ABC-F family ATP-binding cassette domain-containing protein [Candidatus Saccharimonadales bacterium]
MVVKTAMLLHVTIDHKSIGNKLLFTDLQLHIEAGEKVAIIGRNGVGKTTLFRMLTGEDTEFGGTTTFKNGIRLVATAQEHHDVGEQTVADYIVTNLPEYASLKHILDTYPDTMGDNLRKIEKYSDALERFSTLDYYTVEDRVRRSLDDYQLGDAADRPMKSLSGGQKRFVELIRVEHSDADLALIDEPTNHMDYLAKAAFLQWFEKTQHAVVVITHDRDLLQKVDRITEIKDQKAFNFPGNYDAYIRQNASRTAADLNEYDTVQRRIANVKKQIQAVRAKKASTSKTPNPFIPLENRLVKELEELQQAERPSFWIDQESVASLKSATEESYQKHKARSIRIRRIQGQERIRELLKLTDVQVGYDKPLFEPLNIYVETGDRFQIAGRNGVGKTTLVRTIMQSQQDAKPATLLQGAVRLDKHLRMNTYEQEIDERLLDMTLAAAVEHIYDSFGLPVNNEHIMRLLGDYLFDPHGDREHIVRNLSGGQKARLQLIKLFANEPNLIILDEPTNHLDLPSIEELEAALSQYKGAMLYISHDSYLSKKLGGETVAITPVR